jgi:hypothetical protein
MPAGTKCFQGVHATPPKTGASTTEGQDRKAVVADMVRENAEGSTWASIVALLAVTGTLGALYLPLFLYSTAE